MRSDVVRGGNRSRGGFEKLRLLGSFVLSFLLILGIYYFFYVEKKSSYLVSRNFRFLASIGSQVRDSLNSQDKILQNLGKKEDFVRSLKLDPQQEEDPVKRKWRSDILEMLAPLFERVEIKSAPQPEMNAGDFLPYELQPRTDGYRLGFSRVLPDPTDKPKDMTVSGRVFLAKLLDPLFPQSEAFDSLLLADESGRVYYQEGRADLNMTHLATLLESADEEAHDGERGSPGGDPQGERRLGPGTDSPLFGASDFRDVRLSGRDYRLFVEPINLPIRAAADGSARREESAQPLWLIGGLAPKRELFYQSFAVSSALVTSIMGLLALAILSWPFIKLSLLGEWQRVRLFDVILLGLCSVLGIAILTLFVCDAIAYNRLQREAKEQLRVLSDEIAGHLERETRQAYLQLESLEHRSGSIGKDEKETGEVLGRTKLDDYAFADAFMVLDEEGKQRRKWLADFIATPKISVALREYFSRVHQGESWLLTGGKGAALGRFLVQSTVGLTDGTRAGVISKPAADSFRRAGYPVSALSIPFLSVIDPVLPPGFQFAVINNESADGQVLFHSNPQRNLTESFFVETDQDRRLRAMVFARRAETFDLRYWGEDYLARVAPVRDMPWTIVVLRDKRFLRAVNVDWITSTALFIILYVGAMTVALILLVAARPAYRAPWIWPEPRRDLDFVQLVAAYLLLAVGFGGIVEMAQGGEELLWSGVLLPVVAWSITYLRLAPRGKGTSLARGIWLLALFLLLYFALTAPAAGEWVQRILSCLLIVAGCVLAAVPQGVLRGLDEKWRSMLSDKVLMTRSYPAAGLLLLALTAALPTVGFFKVAYQLQFKNLVKHGQLKMAMALKERENRVRKRYRWRSGPKECFIDFRLAADPDQHALAGLDVYSAPFFSTEIHLPRRARSCPTWLRTRETKPLPGPLAAAVKDCRYDGRETHPPLSEALESALPPSSEYAKDMRELLHEGAADSSWHWHQVDGYLILHMHDELGSGQVVLVSRLDEAGGEPDVGPAGGSAARTMRAGMTALDKSLEGFLPLAALVGFLLAILFYVVRFVSRKVFLLGIGEPLWSGRVGALPPTVGSNVFLISRKEEWPLEQDKFFPLHFQDLEGDRSVWAGRRLERIRSLPDRNLLVKGFEHRISDPAFNEIKMAFLEELLEEHQGAVVVLSTVSPLALERPRESSRRTGTVMRTGATLKERWQKTLASFTVIDLDLRTNGATAGAGKERSRAALLRREAGSDPFLRQIAADLLRQAAQMDRDQLLEEFGERAESRYRAIWESCSQDEQVVLEHLAEEGFINEKNRRLVRRLMARGLIECGPELRLFNESFRRFVASADCRSEVLDVERQAEPSAWDRFRWPFFVGLSATIAFFFATQQALLEGTVATITGLAAGLPALVKLLDLFSGGRASLRADSK